jgi:hypothetical protein
MKRYLTRISARRTVMEMAGSPPLRVASWFLVAAVLAVTAGCSNPQTTWSAEAPSPDSQWVALARTEQWSGPGNAYNGTVVYLEPRGSKERTTILGFDHDFPRMNLRMIWLTSTHLQVLYGPQAGDSVSLDFQAVKAAGSVEITVQRLPARSGN